MINIRLFRDEGVVTGSRGTPLEVTNFNMKDSASYTVEYYTTEETTGAALIRPTVAGEQMLSYKVYTFIMVEGAAERLKNLRFKVTREDTADADKAQLFYKMTNVYAAPDNAFDGDMLLMANNDGVVLTPTIYPNLSTVGPHLATTRAVEYTSYPLYTNYFVTQMRVNKDSLVGNTAEFKLRFEAYEYEV